jgi:hypothetical protein
MLGDLATESLRDVWQGERFRRLRRALFTRNGLADFAICEKCNLPEATILGPASRQVVADEI